MNDPAFGSTEQWLSVIGEKAVTNTRIEIDPRIEEIFAKILFVAGVVDRIENFCVIRILANYLTKVSDSVD